MIYFPGLNALRFIAAAAVILFHTEHRKFIFQKANLYSGWPFLERIGELGVTFFFVISGFLITYLLLAERKQNGSISIRSFYVRRILRIWPLYYFIIILSFFVLCNIPFFDIPAGTTESVHSNFLSKFLLFLAFLPNAAFLLFGHVPFAKQSWSVGVEEQFYLSWPWIVRYAKTFKQLMFVLSLVMLVFVGGRYVIAAIRVRSLQASYHDVVDFIANFMNLLRFGCMAIGAAGAGLLFFERNRLLALIYNRYVQLITYCVLFFFLAKGVKNYLITDEVYSVLFILIILNICSNTKSFVKLQYKPLDFLGKISYGLYMYHDILIISMIKIFIIAGLSFTSVWANALLYVSIWSGTILVAYFSYQYLEKPFLRYKMNFTFIRSGNEGREMALKIKQ